MALTALVAKFLGSQELLQTPGGDCLHINLDIYGGCWENHAELMRN